MEPGSQPETPGTPADSPGGTSENSQAFQRLERDQRVSSPAGTADSWLRFKTLKSVRPFKVIQAYSS